MHVRWQVILILMMMCQMHTANLINKFIEYTIPLYIINNDEKYMYIMISWSKKGNQQSGRLLEKESGQVRFRVH